MADSMVRAWAELVGHLEARKRELSAAVRAYPTPIARCDDQLPKAIAQRDAAARAVKEAADVDAARAVLSDPAWRERVRDFARRFAADDAAAAEDACSRILAAPDPR